MAGYLVTFEPAGVTVEADPAAYPYASDGLPGSLLDIALGAGVHIEHACGGVGACGTCHVIVEEGADNLSEPGNTPASRLACRAVVCGDVTVRIPDWNRNAVSEEEADKEAPQWPR